VCLVSANFGYRSLSKVVGRPGFSEAQSLVCSKKKKLHHNCNQPTEAKFPFKPPGLKKGVELNSEQKFPMPFRVRG
jgi:hypothetical protein